MRDLLSAATRQLGAKSRSRAPRIRFSSHHVHRGGARDDSKEKLRMFQCESVCLLRAGSAFGGNTTTRGKKQIPRAANQILCAHRGGARDDSKEKLRMFQCESVVFAACGICFRWQHDNSRQKADPARRESDSLRVTSIAAARGMTVREFEGWLNVSRQLLPPQPSTNAARGLSVRMHVAHW